MGLFIEFSIIFQAKLLLCLMKTQPWFKETISDSLRLTKKSSKTFRYKEKNCQSQHVPFFVFKSHKFDRKTFLSSDFIVYALSTVSLHGKIFLHFGITFRVSLSINLYKIPWITISYFKKNTYCCPMWKNTLKLQKKKNEMIPY